MTPSRPIRRAPFIALLAALFVSSLEVSAGDPPPRPLLPVYSSAAAVTAACDATLESAQRAVNALAGLALDDATNTTTLERWDGLVAQLDDVWGPMAVTLATHQTKAVREAAEACELRLSRFQTSVFQNAALYAHLRATNPASAAGREVKAVALEQFEDAGVALPADKRARAKEILDRLDALAVEFQRNTRENLGTITMSVADLEGLPKSYLDAHPADADGNVVLKMNYPDFIPFRENAISAEARRRYHLAFNRVGGERNLAILNEAARLRKELAGLFGQPSFAHKIIARRMAGSPEKVLAFLDSVRDKVTEVEKRDIEILRQAKADFLGRPLAEVRIERWDVGFYTERVRRAKFAVDQNELRRYFPTEASVAWLTELANSLFGVRFVRADVPVWHPDVRYFDILDDKGRRIAGAYFDLYPREGKYNHAAVWPARGSSTQLGRTPISVMVANLNREGLDHNELETLLHEFGHMLHGTLSRTEYVMLSGTSVRRDFVEAPSQMLEEWVRKPEPLALMRKHCPECPTVDAGLLKRLNQAKRFGAGMHYARQHLLASFDMAMAGPQPGDSLATYRSLEEASPLGYMAGTMFPARFDHVIGGYAAGYYGYMWSEVIALDMASQWRGKLLDPVVSRRYLDSVLARGGETPPEVLVRGFLGRDPSPEPFFAVITGKDHD